jgi:hypothetical protein
VEDIDFGVGFVAGNSKIKLRKKIWGLEGKKNQLSPECVHTWAKHHKLH